MTSSYQTQSDALSKDFVHPFGGMSARARYPVGVAVKDKVYAGVPGGVLNVVGVRATSEQDHEAAMRLY